MIFDFVGGAEKVKFTPIPEFGKNLVSKGVKVEDDFNPGTMKVA